MVRFHMLEPTHPDLNLRFNIRVTYLQLIIFLVIDDVLIDNETLVCV
jgi:hypothetical protein